jgi:hypothetical protein
LFFVAADMSDVHNWTQTIKHLEAMSAVVELLLTRKSRRSKYRASRLILQDEPTVRTVPEAEYSFSPIPAFVDAPRKKRRSLHCLCLYKARFQLHYAKPCSCFVTI